MRHYCEIINIQQYMNLILITDIYGKTDKFLTWSAKTKCAFRHTEIISPFDNGTSFINETSAYEYFIKNVGHDTYKNKVSNLLNAVFQPTFIAAFSAGASAAWRSLSETNNHHIDRAILFYPGQIRNHLNLEQKTDFHIIFPKIERHFDIDTVSQCLRKSRNISIDKTNYLHGFMNEYSQNYSCDGLVKYSQIILDNGKFLGS